MSLNGKTLFITGASRGIGLAIGLRAARDGANVVIAAKTAEPHPKLPGTIYTAAEEIEAATFVTKRANMALTRSKFYAGKTETPVEVNLLQIGPAMLVGTQGEPFVEIGLQIKERSPFAHTWFGGYTSGWAGYIPMPDAYPLKGYEVETSPFTPDAAGKLVEGTVGLLEALGTGH